MYVLVSWSILFDENLKSSYYFFFIFFLNFQTSIKLSVQFVGKEDILFLKVFIFSVYEDNYGNKEEIKWYLIVNRM